MAIESGEISNGQILEWVEFGDGSDGPLSDIGNRQAFLLLAMQTNLLNRRIKGQEQVRDGHDQAIAALELTLTLSEVAMELTEARQTSGYTVAEVARLLGLTDQAVRNRGFKVVSTERPALLDPQEVRAEVYASLVDDTGKLERRLAKARSLGIRTPNAVVRLAED